MTSYHAVTLFIQNGKVFNAATRRIELSSLPPRRDEVSEHLAAILEDNCNAQWGCDFEVPNQLELGKLSAEEVAVRLTDPLNNLPPSGITYTVLTLFTEYPLNPLRDEVLKQEEEELLAAFKDWAQHRDNQSLAIKFK
jgi:hypothetical protein